MIKSWQKFFESKLTIHFQESDEFLEVKDKYKLPDQTIKQYLTDLLDEAADIEINSTMFEQSYGALINYSIEITKSFAHPGKTPRSAPTNIDYQSFLKDQLNLLKISEESIKRLCDIQDLKQENNLIIQCPFWGAGSNMKEFSDFTWRIHLIQKIETKDLEHARTKFEQSNNPVKKHFDELVKILKSKGVKEAERLIDTQDISEHNIIMYGFLSDDEIIVIADYDTQKQSIFIHQDEILRAVEEYKRGGCGMTLGFED
jgi:hypothetical protein